MLEAGLSLNVLANYDVLKSKNIIGMKAGGELITTSKNAHELTADFPEVRKYFLPKTFLFISTYKGYPLILRCRYSLLGPFNLTHMQHMKKSYMIVICLSQMVKNHRLHK